MWMPKESRVGLTMPLSGGPARGGGVQAVGVVVRPPQRQTQHGQSPQDTRETIIFRIQTDTGQMVNCRFEGTLSGLLEQGDRVTVIGGMDRGVLCARTIADEQGTVIAQAATACFVATVVCGDPLAPEVLRLRRFRDERLAARPWGRRIVRWYYQWGPKAAAALARRPALRRAVRWCLVRPLSALTHIALTGTEKGSRHV